VSQVNFKIPKKSGEFFVTQDEDSDVRTDRKKYSMASRSDVSASTHHLYYTGECGDHLSGVVATRFFQGNRSPLNRVVKKVVELKISFGVA